MGAEAISRRVKHRPLVKARFFYILYFLYFYAMGTEAISRRVKQQGRKADNSAATTAETKNTCIYTLTLPYVFLVDCLIS
jgi:hypothetical protein